MAKHAYLIMAHNNFVILKELLLQLDYYENDIFIHIDKKQKRFPKNEIMAACKFSRVFLIKRINVNWGGYSQIKCEISLFQEAFITEKYQFFHLLSGVDYPLKTQSEIHDFFDNYPENNFIHFDAMKGRSNIDEDVLFKRIGLYKFFQDWRRRNYFFSNIIQWVDSFSIKIQQKLGINRIDHDVKYMKGANWASLNYEFVGYILRNKRWIKKHFKYSFCCDEIYKQTLIWNSPYRDTIYWDKCDDSNIANQREIDWKRGHPYVWDIEDYKHLISSECLFARKFDEKKMKIVYKLKENLQRKLEC